ncbi:MAG: hypothetical protein HYZ28_14375 [Myxococcales bacterium]|nr:hypothetical protein [Myxococcales bacterium]
MADKAGELVALRKADADLEAGTIAIAQSWGADTTKGNRAALLPIHPELRPYLTEAIRRSPSELVFPAANGRMHSRNLDLAEMLRGAMKRAGLVDGYEHVCRRCKARGTPHVERHPDSALRRCPTCNMKLWPRALPRKMRFHDLRGTRRPPCSSRRG